MNRISQWICVAASLFLAAVARASAMPATTAPALAATPGGIEFFETKIRPVLAEQCYRCHSAKAEKLKGKLLLDTREGILKGGESDNPAIVPNNLDDSTLIRAIRWEDEGLQMPPKKKLPAEQIAAFETWVKLGAPMPPTAQGAKPAALAVGPTTAPAPLHGLSLAEGRKFWSFIPPREQQIPVTTKPNWARTDIDRFILAKLEEKHLSPSPPADKRTLIRRATYDLIGLPPTPAEIDAFEKDPSPDAFEKVIDRLLASPHYGERWGRYWLDVARYADTKGYVFMEERRYAFSYTYRDWVVRALNEDLPYDQFLIQQIAADRLDLKKDKRPLAALGFLTLGRRFLNSQPDIIDDRIDVVCRGTMGLTVACARCHDHKYDPIPTADYYSLYGVFASSKEPDELPLLAVPATRPAAFEAELAKRRGELDSFVKSRHAAMLKQIKSPPVLARYLLAAQKGLMPADPQAETVDDDKTLSRWLVARWQGRLKDAAAKDDGVFAPWRRLVAIRPSEFKSKAGDALTASARSMSDDPVVTHALLASGPPATLKQAAERLARLLAAFDLPDAQPDPNVEAVRQVLAAPDAPTAVALADVAHILQKPDRDRKRDLQAKVEEWLATSPDSPPRAMAMEDLPTPVTPHIFVRGNAANIGKEVPRQFPAILSGDDRKPFKDGSGRLELAKAIASKDNPLTARVMVNRVWQYHFGQGLVRTPSDFGTRGDPPTHPELLDYLALRFANDDGWSIKKLHKQIMLSAAYQQASVDRPEARAVDPENKLLWRMTPRRLDFEALRDSLLATSGQIDLTLGGRPVEITTEPFTPRRTIYAFIDRQNLPGVFRTFDFASPDSTSGKRFTTSVPQQALFMMNSRFVIEQAKKLVARPEVAKETDAAKRVAELYRVVLGRSPDKEEAELALKFVQAGETIPNEPIAATRSPWQYGVGEFDEASGRVTSFTPLPHFDGKQWQGGPTLPDPKLGWAMLSANGGHVGNDVHHAVIRRWVAPRNCVVGVDGKVVHPQKEGDGIRARLVTTADGLLVQWNLHHRSAETRIAQLFLKQGEAIDFVVDCGRAGDFTFDGFTWTVTITKQAAPEPVAGDDTGTTWDSAVDFSGPTPKPPTPLTPWERYAQVLLESNEFAFVD